MVNAKLKLKFEKEVKKALKVKKENVVKGVVKMKRKRRKNQAQSSFTCG